jgi:hypothetical protein
LLGGALPLKKKGMGRELFLFFVFEIKGSKIFTPDIWEGCDFHPGEG